MQFRATITTAGLIAGSLYEGEAADDARIAGLLDAGFLVAVADQPTPPPDDRDNHPSTSGRSRSRRVAVPEVPA